MLDKTGDMTLFVVAIGKQYGFVTPFTYCILPAKSLHNFQNIKPHLNNPLTSQMITYFFFIQQRLLPLRKAQQYSTRAGDLAGLKAPEFTSQGHQIEL